MGKNDDFWRGLTLIFNLLTILVYLIGLTYFGIMMLWRWLT